MKNIIIIGATSAMAEEVAKLYAMEKANLYLIARNSDKLAAIQQDLYVRGANTVTTDTFSANNFDTHKEMLDKAFESFKVIDVILIAHGNLPDQVKCQHDVSITIDALNTNGLSVIALLTHAANKMELQKSGHIGVITSVAGDRGRQSNYVYGAAKGMISIFLQGLAQRLYKSGVHVLDIKPGFVDTPMTAEFNKSILWAKPESIALIIKRRIENKSQFSYVPSFWVLIMLIIKNIPNFIFNKAKL